MDEERSLSQKERKGIACINPKEQLFFLIWIDQESPMSGGALWREEKIPSL